MNCLALPLGQVLEHGWRLRWYMYGSAQTYLVLNLPLLMKNLERGLDFCTSYQPYVISPLPWMLFSQCCGLSKKG
jgi:hypothetical protein